MPSVTVTMPAEPALSSTASIAAADFRAAFTIPTIQSPLGSVIWRTR
jgi:hypothetical protein